MKGIVISAIAATAIMAQPAKADYWSLDSCISYALTHNIEIRQRVLAARQGELAVKEAKDAVLPRVDGYSSENFSFGRGLTALNTYANRNTNAFSVGASLSLPLFQGLRVVRNVDYSKTSLRALVERSEAIKDDVTANVMALYLQALYARENLSVARMSLSVSEKELRRREQLLEAGKIPELDLYEARAQTERDHLTVVNAENDSTLALLDLANLLNIGQDRDFDILPLEETDGDIIPTVEEVWNNVTVNNHTLRAASIEREAAEKGVSLAKTGYIPTLSFNAGIGTNYYKTTGYDNESFSAQMKNNFSKSLGFSLNIPIFDAFSTRNSVSRARLQQLNAELDLENTRMTLYKTISTAYTQAVAAQTKETTAAAAEQSSLKAFEAMSVKYDNGRANATEYEKAKADYMNALAERIQARYEKLLRIKILNLYNK